MDIFRYFGNPTPDAKRTPWSLEIVITIAVALVAFYFISKFLNERFPNLDSETKGFIAKIMIVVLMVLVMFIVTR